MLSSRFKLLCSDAGLSIDEAAKLLHVTPRTIRYWFSAKVTVPYAAYKLVRVLRWFELPGKQWTGWHFHSGKLWTPEGHGFQPSDSSWWGLTVRRSRLFGELYDRQNALNQALRAGRPDGQTGERDPRSRHGLGGLAGPNGVAGGAAQPPCPNLLLEHFRTQHVVEAPKTPAVRGETQNWLNPSYKVHISYGGKQGMRP